MTIHPTHSVRRMRWKTFGHHRFELGVCFTRRPWRPDRHVGFPRQRRQITHRWRGRCGWWANGTVVKEAGPRPWPCEVKKIVKAIEWPTEVSYKSNVLAKYVKMSALFQKSFTQFDKYSLQYHTIHVYIEAKKYYFTLERIRNPEHSSTCMM